MPPDLLKEFLAYLGQYYGRGGRKRRPTDQPIRMKVPLFDAQKLPQEMQQPGMGGMQGGMQGAGRQEDHAELAQELNRLFPPN